MIGTSKQSCTLVFIACAVLAGCSSGLLEPGAGLEPATWTVSTAPVRVAQAASMPKKTKTVSPGPGNARGVIMIVVAYNGKGRVLDDWKGQTRWSGPLITYHARLEKSGKLQWVGKQAVGVRVETDANGRGGQSLESWLPPGTTEVFITVKPEGSGKSPGGGTGSKTSRSSKPKKPDIRNASSGSGGRSAGRGGGSSGKAHASAGSGSAVGTRSNESRTHGRSSGGAGSSAGGSNPGAGSKYGRPGGDSSGHEQGRSAALGGVADAYSSRTTGELFGDKEGARGGDGSAGDAGARGAFALFGGVLNLPRDYRAAVEVAIIGGQALTPETAFKAVSSKGMGAMKVLRLRTELRREARAYARAEVKRVEELFPSELAKMSEKERAHLLEATRHQKMREYFDQVEEGARRRRMELQDEASKNPGHDSAELEEAIRIEEAVAVKPVEGRFPLNHAYAGKTYPVSNINRARHPRAVEAIERRGLDGVTFTREGYPDFTPWMYEEGVVTADVRITYTGKRYSDFNAADDAMRRKLGDPTWERPDNYTWHHHEDVGRMILLPTPLNHAVGHTGGVPMYRMTTGDYDAYPRI